MRDSLNPEHAPGSVPRSPQAASTPANGDREGRGAHAAPEGPSEASSGSEATEPEGATCSMPRFMSCNCNHIDGCQYPITPNDPSGSPDA